MISERLHDVQDVQEHLGRWQVAGPCGWTTSCHCYLNWAQYQMKSQHGRHDVGAASLERRKESQGRKTHNTSWWKMTSLFVSRKGWGSGRIDDEIRRLSKHFVKQQASPMPHPPRAKVWWARAATIDVLHNDSPQVTKLTISSCSDPPQATLKWFQKKNIFIVWCILLRRCSERRFWTGFN